VILESFPRSNIMSVVNIQALINAVNAGVKELYQKLSIKQHTTSKKNKG
jgi:hypothetical protein